VYLFVDRREEGRGEERKSERGGYKGKWKLSLCFGSIIFLYLLRLDRY
jgi:hypothetical protein